MAQPPLDPAQAGIATTEFPLRVSTLIAVLAGLTTLSAMPAMAQTSADFGKFSEACMGGEAFLLGQVPEGVDSSTILTPLCGCLNTAFKDMPQGDVDMLAADLRGEGTDEAHKAYGDYAKLTEQARVGLNNCFASTEVATALKAAQPPAADPAAPAPAAPATPQ